MWLEPSRQREGAGDRFTGKGVTSHVTLSTRALTLRAPGGGGLSRRVLPFDSRRVREAAGPGVGMCSGQPGRLSGGAGGLGSMGSRQHGRVS